MMCILCDDGTKAAVLWHGDSLCFKCWKEEEKLKDDAVKSLFEQALKEGYGKL
jgi:hypothetical protein